MLSRGAILSEVDLHSSNYEFIPIKFMCLCVTLVRNDYDMAKKIKCLFSILIYFSPCFYFL